MKGIPTFLLLLFSFIFHALGWSLLSTFLQWIELCYLHPSQVRIRNRKCLVVFFFGSSRRLQRPSVDPMVEEDRQKKSSNGLSCPEGRQEMRDHWPENTTDCWQVTAGSSVARLGVFLFLSGVLSCLVLEAPSGATGRPSDPRNGKTWRWVQTIHASSPSTSGKTLMKRQVLSRPGVTVYKFLSLAWSHLSLVLPL